MSSKAVNSAGEGKTWSEPVPVVIGYSLEGAEPGLHLSPGDNYILATFEPPCPYRGPLQISVYKAR